MSSWLSFLPHQIPFRAASAITHLDERTVEGTFLCTASDPLGVDASLMVLEAMAQLGGCLAFRERGGIAYLTGIDRCTLDRPIFPGDLVTLAVTLDVAFGSIVRFSAVGSIEGLQCLRGRFYLSEPAAP